MPENAGKNLGIAKVKVDTTDGRRDLVATNRTVYELEKSFGSIKAYVEKMANGGYMETVSAFFSLAWGVDQEDAIELIKPGQMSTYFDAITELLAAFLGADIKQVPPGEAPAAKAAEDGRSPGNGTSASPSLSVASPPRSSGTR